MVTFHTAIWPYKKKYRESLDDISAVRFMNIRAATEWTDWRRIHNQNIITPKLTELAITTPLKTIAERWG